MISTYYYKNNTRCNFFGKVIGPMTHKKWHFRETDSHTAEQYHPFLAFQVSGVTDSYTETNYSHKWPLDDLAVA